MSTTSQQFSPSDVYAGMHAAWRVGHYAHAKFLADGLFELARMHGPHILTERQWAITREIQSLCKARTEPSEAVQTEEGDDHV